MFISSVRYLCGTYILTEDEHFGSFLFEVSFYTIIRTLSEEALAILKDNYDYDLIFMDVNMPLINGYEASKFIKEKISPDIAVYIISGNDILGEFDKISQAKADGYLEKPIDIKKIEKIIREIFH